MTYFPANTLKLANRWKFRVEKKQLSQRIFGKRVKKVAKKLAYRRRHLRLTSNDQVRARRIKKAILIKLHIDETMSKDDREILEIAFKAAAINYLDLVSYDHVDPKPQ